MTHRQAGFVVAVVDDDEGILQSLEYLLESADYEVVSFGSAKAMLHSGCLWKIDCLISDIDMPGLDGFDLWYEVHAVRPQLPTVLITGYPERLLRLPSAIAGSNLRTFIKPFQGRDLLDAVAAALEEARRGHAAG